MRDLHARHGARRRRFAETKSTTNGSRHSQRTRRESLSLHRLYEDLRISCASLPEVRAFIPDYQLTTPASLAEALALLESEPGVWKPFAGGTDLMVLLEAGKLPDRNYINIWRLDELRGIDANESHVTLGALTTYTE